MARRSMRHPPRPRRFRFDGAPASSWSLLSWVVGLAGLIAAWPAAAWADPPAGSYTLAVNIGYNPSGTIVSSPAGVNCDFPSSGPCDGTFPAGTVVTLTATPTHGASFEGWWTFWSMPPTPSYPGCTSARTCTVTMTSPVTIDATFVPPAPPPVSLPPWTLTVAITGGGSGSVTGPGITCPNVCSSTYPWNQRVSLIATPAPGSSFAGWSGACSGADTCQVSPPAFLPGPDEQVTAQFAPGPKMRVGRRSQRPARAVCVRALAEATDVATERRHDA